MSWSCFILLLMVAWCWAAPPSPAGDNAVVTEDTAAPTTHALLSKLGLKRLRVPAAHHRKRLAEQARRRATGDSRMFLIKLPPSQHYYAHAAPAAAAARTIPVPLHSNGKPAKVYHWNIPVLQKLANADNFRSNGPQARLDDRPTLDVEGTPTWGKEHRPHPNSIDAPAYYVPSNPKKSSFRKYFSGNGKPKSFYVIEKSKKPSHYHRLLP